MFTIIIFGVAILFHAFLSCYAVKWCCGGLKLSYGKACGYSTVILITGAIIGFVIGFAIGLAAGLLYPVHAAENIEKIPEILLNVLIFVLAFPFVAATATGIYGKFIKHEDGTSIGFKKGFFVFLVVSLLAFLVYAVLTLPQFIVSLFIES
ncbi:MAG: hypothetical protein LBT09_00830 [Planctomycetaceae bacterium]|nr:hypothetical protein [Planctomycetaceae bacterium]